MSRLYVWPLAVCCWLGQIAGSLASEGEEPGYIPKSRPKVDLNPLRIPSSGGTADRSDESFSQRRTSYMRGEGESTAEQGASWGDFDVVAPERSSAASHDTGAPRERVGTDSGLPDDSAVHRRAAAPAVQAAVAATVPADERLLALRAQVKEGLAELEKVEGLDETAKGEIRKRYQSAEERLSLAETAMQNRARFAAELAQSPSTLAGQVKEELARQLPEPEIQLGPTATLHEIEQQHAAAQSRLSQANEQLKTRREELEDRGARIAKLRKMLDDCHTRIDEAKQLLELPPAQDEPEIATSARRLELECRMLTTRSRQQWYQLEHQWYEKFSELLPLRRDLAMRGKTIAEKEVARWQQLLDDYRQRDSDRLAQEARRQIENVHPALGALAERNVTLANLRRSLRSTHGETTDNLKHVTQELETIGKSYDDTRKRVEKAGHSSTVGLILRRQREQLPALSECRRRIRQIERTMPEANLARLEFEEERAAVSDIESAIPRVMVSLQQNATGTDNAMIEATLRELLVTKRDLLDNLISEYDQYLSKLVELEVTTRGLLAKTTEFGDYIGQHVLWIRSCDMVWKQDIAKSAKAVLTLAHPAPWWEVTKKCGLDTLRHPAVAIGVALAAGLVLLFQTRLKIRFLQLCAAGNGVAGYRLAPTLEAMALAALITAAWPMIYAYLGWRLTLGEVSSWAEAVGTAFIHGGFYFWLSRFIRLICRPSGLAEYHFGWSTYGLKVIRREVTWVTYIGLPLVVVVVLTQIWQAGEWNDSLGRLAFIGSMLVVVNFMHSLLNGKEGVFREVLARQPSAGLDRLRLLAYLVGTGCPAALAIMATVGYFYSAQQLAWRWQFSWAFIGCLILLHALISRWFTVLRRQLGISQARQRLHDGHAAAEPGRTDHKVAAEDLPDLSALHKRLQYLLRHAVLASALIGGWYIWSDMLPALHIFDRVVLWNSTVEMTEMVEDEDHKTTKLEKVQKQIPTTLRHALLATALLVGTLVIGRNVPALLEIALIDRLPLDRGGRHAIAIILHYAVALTGVFLACRALSVNWSSVQWLAAGMTVGLGFGLQEIFANLFSGLILLLERPIRVGDVITLGDVTGTVSNIRIRATTVTSWDRKELIVPNKELITGRLLNWTLSDTTNRIMVNVGVSYNSDPVRTRSILTEIVVAHPNVLRDPAPAVSFEKFGESSIDFVIRAFLATMDVRLQTIDELHTQIFQRLKEEGIEIPFPQRDLNVRKLESILPEAAAQVLKRAA